MKTRPLPVYGSGMGKSSGSRGLLVCTKTVEVKLCCTTDLQIWHDLELDQITVQYLASRRALRSSARGELLVPLARSALKQRRAFSVIGPSTWNELPLTLRLLPQNNMSSFCKLLKTFLFDCSWTENASE